MGATVSCCFYAVIKLASSYLFIVLTKPPPPNSEKFMETLGPFNPEKQVDLWQNLFVILQSSKFNTKFFREPPAAPTSTCSPQFQCIICVSFSPVSLPRLIPSHQPPNLAGIQWNPLGDSVQRHHDLNKEEDQ